ncbi:MAG: sensor histidine kinase [Acidobacteria bacterium]|nr:sensor histidine kinase [Acidobacteriota bacterium]
MKEVSDHGPKRFITFPTRAFIGVVAFVCLGLAGSAAYDFARLSNLREEYLRQSASEIAAALDAQMRGPRRGIPGAWQALFTETTAARGSVVAFMALVDEAGQISASAGDRFASAFSGPAGFLHAGEAGLYVYDQPLQMPGRGGGQGGLGAGPGFGGGQGRRAPPRALRIGVYSASADFIRWQAITHLVINGIAIGTLVLLAGYFLRTLRRFLQLKAREESARHLTALGAMAATLAHEIRNPLGAMKGLTQLAQEDLPGDHKTQTLMSTVVHEAERLEQLVTDLLTFARPRDPQISRFDFSHLLSDVQSVLQPKLDAAQLRMEATSGNGNLVIASDEGGVRQILLNVLLNAMESTPAGGEISVTVRVDEKNRQLVAEIDDSGSGIGARDPEELFQPFATTKTKGTGLGLPISRQIAERLGGTLNLANRQAGGARCTLRLPVQAPL